MPRDEKGRFIKNSEGMSIQLPPLLSMLKYLLISIVLYPWYYVITKSGKVDTLMGHIFPVNPYGETPTPTPANSNLGNSGNLENSKNSALDETARVMGNKK